LTTDPQPPTGVTWGGEKHGSIRERVRPFIERYTWLETDAGRDRGANCHRRRMHQFRRVLRGTAKSGPTLG